MVARIACCSPMVLLVCVTRSFGFMVFVLSTSALNRRLCGGSRPSVEELVGLLAALLRDLLEVSQRLQCLDRGANDVVRIRAAEALGQDVVNARALDDGAHGTAGDDARSRRSGLEKHAPAAEMTERLMRNGHAVERNAKDVLPGLIVSFANGLGNLVG